MATFEALAKANSEIKTTNIKGKEYAEVNEKRAAKKAAEAEEEIIEDMAEAVAEEV